MSTEVYALSHKTQAIVIGYDECTAHLYSHLGTTSYMSTEQMDKLLDSHMHINPEFGIILFDNEPSPVIKNVNSGAWLDCNESYPGELIGFLMAVSGESYVVVQKSPWEISSGGQHVISYNDKGEKEKKGEIKFSRAISYRTRHVNVNGVHVIESTYVDVDGCVHDSMDSLFAKYEKMAAKDLADAITEHKENLIANRISDLEDSITLDEELIFSAKERIVEKRKELEALREKKV
jgi:hypothetical protein